MTSNLGLQIFDTFELGSLLADFTSRAKNLRFGSGEHGFSHCSWFVNMSVDEAFNVYGWPGIPHVVISFYGVIWEGRLEDIAIVEGGVQLGAFGYWRALGDVPYTALWSSTEYKRWNVAPEGTITTMFPDRFKFHNNQESLFIGLVKNAAYSYVYPYVDRGAYQIEIPHRASRNFKAITFDYEFYASSDWTAQLLLLNMLSTRLWGTLHEEWSLVGNGAVQSGSQSIVFSGSNNTLSFSLFATAGNTYTGETGDRYLKITNVRVKTTGSTYVLSSEIAAALAAYVNGVNSDQISTDTAMISTTTTDLFDELYEDLYPNEILESLALRETYRAAVWEDRELYFGARGVGRSWYVDATKFEIERSLENVRNSAYAKYRDANNRTVRTATADDADSQTRYGVVRRGFINVATSDGTEAIAHRDAWLTDNSDYVIRARVEFDRLLDVNGAEYPLYELRADDLVFIRNLPPTLSADIDNVRSFRVGATEYDADNDEIHVEPDIPTPTLVTLIARKQ